MIFECDPDKDEANRVKHGVQLLFGAQIFDDPHVAIIPTLRIDDEEERFKAIGVVDRRPVDRNSCLARRCGAVDFGAKEQSG